ncbi:MAG: DUF4157 domain-containing protein [Gammaproteobacteria bacterium]|nr:DUF4157 domain-containing protein [Gammaproteobacteria bacterium]
MAGVAAKPLKQKPVDVPKRRVLHRPRSDHDVQHREVRSILRTANHDSAQRPQVQAKMQLGQADDRFEKEADRVAEQVVSGQHTELASRDVVTSAVKAQSVSVSSVPHAESSPAGNAAQASVRSSGVNATANIAAADVQRLCAECEDELQRKADDVVNDELLEPAGISVGEQLAVQIAAIRGGGQPLAERDFFESRLGYDFSQTRVHTDQAAGQLATRLGARAFTHGNHIVFAQGEYTPHSRAGKKLLAHELTHVVQQGASQQVPSVQTTRDDDVAAQEPLVIPNVAGDKQTGLVDRQAETITWAQIQIPRFKKQDHRGRRYTAESPLKRGKGRTVDRTGDNNPVQRQKWLREVSRDNVRSGLEDRLRTANAGEMPEGSEYVFEVRAAGGRNRYYNGSLDDITTEFMTPTWGGSGRRGIANFFHVDHIVELQLSNWPHSLRGNDLANMELLEGRRNQQSGRDIRDAIMAKINAFIAATDEAYGSTPAEIKTRYTLVFERAEGSGGSTVRRVDYWEREEIEAATHLNAVVAADPTKIGGPGLVRLFSRPNGGVSRAFNWSGNTTAEQPVPSSQSSERYWLKPFVITHKFFKTDSDEEVQSPDMGYLRMHVSQRSKVFGSTEPFDLPLNRFTGARYGGILPDSMRTTIGNLNAKFFSPIAFDALDISGDQGIVATGNINVTLPFFKDNTSIGIRLAEGDIEIFKEFTADEIAIPAPFDINECTLRLGYGLEQGWSAAGQVVFLINGVGEGQVSAAIGQDDGLSASGEFNFDSTLFNPATLQMGYQNGDWSIGGRVGFENGLIPGIDSGSLNVNWANDVLSGAGDVSFNYPWLESGSLEFSHSVVDGFSLGATVNLSDAVPGLRSGTVTARIEKDSEGEWNLGGSISGDLDTDNIPGLTAVVLAGEIQGGIFDAHVAVNFVHDIASGRVTVGVTNRALDENGQPRDGGMTDDFVFYGSGNVELQLTPWLAASTGIAFDQEGSVSIQGGIEVTEDIEILSDEQTPDFDIPRARRPSFDLNIPLASIGVADVALDLNGSLNAYLHTSPLILTDVRLAVFYDFDDPNATQVTGNARLHMDAQAGLEGTLELGLSARVLILRGGGRIALTVGAEMDGNMDLTVQPNWNVQDGFAVDADLAIDVQPIILISLDGYLYAKIDVLIGSIDVWESERLNLADERLPLDVHLGATADARYQEKPRSELTYSGVNWIVPTAEEMQNALVDLVKDKI